MNKLSEMIAWETISGSPVTVGDVMVTPQSQTLTIRWPSGGWVWNRPTAILVERGGHTGRIRVVDVTRVAQLGLLGISLVFGIVSLVLTIRQRRSQYG